MPITITFQGQEKEFPAPDAPRTLAELVWLEGNYPGNGQCMGIGACGRCKVRFLSPAPDLTPIEARVLGPDEQAAHVRLACRQLAVDGIRLVLLADGSALPEAEFSTEKKSAKNAGEILLAVDLGTTSLAWRALNLEGAALAAGQLPNPQLSLGSEVMSRLALAMDKKAAVRLQNLVLDVLEDLCARLEEDFGQVRRIGLAANPAMTMLALGRDSSGLARAPYRLDYAGGGFARAHKLPPIWVPPLLSPFVGGDVTCGLSTLLSGPRPLIMADLGTNGEFILLDKDGDKNKCLAASVPLGPALEGVGMSCGGLAGPGAVTAFRLEPSGLRALTQNGEKPEFISGTGYISLLGNLLQLGLLDRQGHFVAANGEGKGNPALAGLRDKLASRIQSEPDLRLNLDDGLYLSSADVESLLKVKAAFRLALELLIERAGVKARQADIYLAGALGLHAPLQHLLDLGFLPPYTEKRVRAIGNASLDGVSALLPGLDLGGRSPQLSELERAISGCQVLDLAVDPYFQSAYLKGFNFE